MNTLIRASGAPVLLAVAMCWPAAASASVPELTPYLSTEQPRLSFSLPNSQIGLTVGWYAKVYDGDGQFILYWGVDEPQLVVIADQVADRNVFHYAHRDATARNPFGFYRLIYRDSSGQEHVLAEADVRAERNLESGWPAATTLDPQPAHQSAGIALAPPQKAVTMMTSVALSAVTGGLEPPTPPP